MSFQVVIFICERSESVSFSSTSFSFCCASSLPLSFLHNVGILIPSHVVLLS